MDVYIGAWFVGVLGPVIARVVVFPFELGLSDFTCFSECSIFFVEGLGERCRSDANSLGRAI